MDNMRILKFWEELVQCLKWVKTERRVFVLGDMNVNLGSTEIGDAIGKWGVDGVDENQQYLVDINAEKELFLANTFFKHKLIHRCVDKGE